MQTGVRKLFGTQASCTLLHCIQNPFQGLSYSATVLTMLLMWLLPRLSMLRMGLAPCAPFNVTNDLMVAAAKLAREYNGVRLHTHLAENQVCVQAVNAAHWPGSQIPNHGHQRPHGQCC